MPHVTTVRRRARRQARLQEGHAVEAQSEAGGSEGYKPPQALEPARQAMREYALSAQDKHATVNEAFRAIDARKAGTLDWCGRARDRDRNRAVQRGVVTVPCRAVPCREVPCRAVLRGAVPCCAVPRGAVLYSSVPLHCPALARTLRLRPTGTRSSARFLATARSTCPTRSCVECSRFATQTATVSSPSTSLQSTSASERPPPSAAAA